MAFQASSSSSSAAPASGGLNASLLEKLTKGQLLLWKKQVLLDIRGAQLFGILDGSMPELEKELKETDTDGKEVKIPNHAYAQWIASDQTVLSYLVRNMSQEVLTQMVGLTSAASVWKTVMEMFASQSKVHVVQLLTQLNKCIK
jgi:hypothetical protein